MDYKVVPVTGYQQNCCVILDAATGKGVVTDPGGDIAKIEKAIAALGATVEKILLTHGHLDHCGAASQCRERWGVPIIGPHKEDKFWLEALPSQSQMLGITSVSAFSPDQWLLDGDEVQFGSATLNVLHCPGHTPGHVVFVSAAAQLAWVGDVLFRGSVGRSDFPRGDHSTLMRSICEKLLPLGDSIRFIPGHGPESTFGYERLTNPFILDYMQCI